MKLALYRKYRPSGFAELFGQDHVAQTLKNAVKNGSFSHAYLFTGPRGVGKTSVARILAKAINCEQNVSTFKVEAQNHLEGGNGGGIGEPCDKCDSCKSIGEGKEIDIIEIDAASNRGIDEIRELREKIKFTPSRLKYKVFIIDEVHMLTKEAFNALLKTLEEPPAHAIFVLATTEVHKIPQTIISRTQRFDFKRIKIKELIDRLSYIAEKEKISIDKDALSIIAESSEGGFRDAISSLDQIASYKEGKIDVNDVLSILGFTDFKSLLEFVEHLVGNRPREAIILINEMSENGHDMAQFSKNLIEFLRKLMLIKAIGKDEVELAAEHVDSMKALASSVDTDRIVDMIETVSELTKLFQGGSKPQLPLEMAAVRLTSGRTKVPKDDVPEADRKEEKKEEERLKSSEKVPFDSAAGREAKREEQKKLETKGQIRSVTPRPASGEPSMHWNEFLLEVRSKNAPLHAFIKVSEPIFEDESIVLSFPYRFHKDKVQEPKNKKLVEEVLNIVYNKPYKLKCILKKTTTTPHDKKEVSREDTEKVVNSALEIFGGEIVE